MGREKTSVPKSLSWKSSKIWSQTKDAPKGGGLTLHGVEWQDTKYLFLTNQNLSQALVLQKRETFHGLPTRSYSPAHFPHEIPLCIFPLSDTQLGTWHSMFVWQTQRRLGSQTPITDSGCTGPAIASLVGLSIMRPSHARCCPSPHTVLGSWFWKEQYDSKVSCGPVTQSGELHWGLQSIIKYSIQKLFPITWDNWIWLD